LSRSISNIGPQKALNAVAILLLPSHGNFEKTKSKSIIDQKLLQLSCKPKINKNTHLGLKNNDKKLGAQKETYLLPSLMLKEPMLMLCWWMEEE
jgi:hypothetical protein